MSYLKFTNPTNAAVSGIPSETAAYTALSEGVNYESGADGRITDVNFGVAANNPFGTGTSITGIGAYVAPGVAPDAFRGLTASDDGGTGTQAIRVNFADDATTRQVAFTAGNYVRMGILLLQDSTGTTVNNGARLSAAEFRTLLTLIHPTETLDSVADVAARDTSTNNSNYGGQEFANPLTLRFDTNDASHEADIVGWFVRGDSALAGLVFAVGEQVNGTALTDTSVRGDAVFALLAGGVTGGQPVTVEHFANNRVAADNGRAR